MLTWILWGLFLILQNFSFTMVSRARNSGSLVYHALAAVGSNGIWFVSQMFLLSAVFDSLLQGADYWQLAKVGTFYTVMTIIGSVSAHYLLMRYIEKGNRQVGAR